MKRWLTEVWTRALPHRMPLYRMAVVLFLLSTVIDTGSNERKGPLGITVTMVMMLVVTLVGLSLWKAPRDGVLWTGVVLIVAWMWSQILAGQSLRDLAIRNPYRHRHSVWP